MLDGTLRLVGDIGGTNARFGLARIGAGAPAIYRVAHLAVGDFSTARAGIAHYLASLPAGDQPVDAVLAVAGPVVAGVADLTNAQGWHLNEAALASELGLATVKLINDFAALSLSVPLLGAADLRPIGSDQLIDAGKTVSLIGPGTGTGVGARLVDGAAAVILVCEGGHIGFAPVDAVEREVLRVLSGKFGRVSVERILAGQGLVNLHQALAEIDGREIPEVVPNDVTDGALAGDARALATLNRFFGILGTVAGDLALVHGASGVLLAGGILPRVFDLLEASDFRARFEDKGRMSKLVRAVPTNLLVAKDVALLGATSGM
jgi:glucokinase